MLAYLLGPFIQQYFYELIIGGIFLFPFWPFLMRTLTFAFLGLLSLPVMMPTIMVTLGIHLIGAWALFGLLTLGIAAAYFIGFAYNRELDIINYIINGGLL